MTDPFSTLLAAIPGLAKAGADIAAASDEAKRNAQLIEFQRVIIQLQSSIASIQLQNSSLLRDKENLEKQIVDMKNWGGEKQRYSLVTIWDGAVAYAVKESMAQVEPPHWLCPRCYDNGKKAILNPFYGTNKLYSVACPICSVALHYPWAGVGPTPQYAPG